MKLAFLSAIPERHASGRATHRDPSGRFRTERTDERSRNLASAGQA
jgi:hypothetical protein